MHPLVLSRFHLVVRRSIERGLGWVQYVCFAYERTIESALYRLEGGRVNRRFLWILHWGICGWGNSLAKNHLQQNKYSEVNITEHKCGLHDGMKTGIEYRKRKHRITQDEDKQTEVIELRKLRKSSVKVFKQIWRSTQHIYEEIEPVSLVKTMIW